MLGVCVKHNGAAPHFKENMMDIKTKTLNSTLNTLKALGAKYVIMMGDTTHSHGDLQVVDKKSRRAKPTYPHGTYIKLVKDQGIESMKVGDVISFDHKVHEPSQCAVQLYTTLISIGGRTLLLRPSTRVGLKFYASKKEN